MSPRGPSRRPWTGRRLPLLALCLLACSSETPGHDAGPEGPVAEARRAAVEASGEPSVAAIERAVRVRAEQAMEALEARDMEALSPLVHPTLGVRFSPYGFVDLDHDVVLSRDELRSAWSGAGVRRWGTEDGTGEPIESSFADYFERFVYDEDFAAAEETSLERALGRGNTINNAAEVYPAAVLVEHHFSGFDPRYEGMDWKSLRLAFERHEGEWYLVGIIHDQWTI